MANRFNNWAKTDYTALPIDAYAMALQNKEAESMQNLQQTKSQYDILDNVEALTNPDQAKKQAHLEQIQKGLETIHKKSLKSVDTLTELNKLVYDKKRLNDFYAIARQTANIKRLQKDADAHLKEYGVDYNTDEFTRTLKSYNDQGLDATKFKPDMFSNMSINKYTDIPIDMREQLGKWAKESGIETLEQSSDGLWHINKSANGVSSEELFKDANVMINDPKYQSQMRTMLPYFARQNGSGNEEEGFKAMGSMYIKNNVLKAENELSKYKDLSADERKKYGITDTMLAEKQKEVDEINDKLKNDKYSLDEHKSFATQSMVNNLIMQAIAPLDFMKTKTSIVANPYKMEEYKFQTEMAKQQQAHRNAIAKDNNASQNNVWENDQRHQQNLKYAQLQAQQAGTGAFAPSDGTYSNFAVSEDELSKQLDERFGALGVKDDGTEIEAKQGFTEFLKEAFFTTPGSNANTEDMLNSRPKAKKQIADLHSFAKQTDPEGYREAFGNSTSIVPSNSTQEQYLANMLSKVKSATKSYLQNQKVYPITESQGFNEDGIKGEVLNSFAQGTPVTVYKNGKKVNLNVSDLLSNGDKKASTYEDIKKQMQVSLREDGKYSIGVTDNAGNNYNVVMDTPTNVSKYFENTNKVLNPQANGLDKTFSKGNILLNGQPRMIFTKSKLNTKQTSENNEYEFQQHYFTPFINSVDNKPITLSKNDNLVQSIGEKHGKNIKDWVNSNIDKMPLNDIRVLNLKTGVLNNIESAKGNGENLTISKDENGNVYILDGIEEDASTLSNQAMNSFKMINPKYIKPKK